MSNMLDKIDTPRDLKSLSLEEMQDLAADVRELIIDTVSRSGGHLAANLGVVELTIALLKVFDPPADKILWDVGHQTYTYKILTGRKDRFRTIRQAGGLSGFQKREESEYDAFGAGHSGTAVSAALGMAVARDQRGDDEHVVAIVGDAAASCGISLEGLNNLAAATDRMIVILNDNEMSIAANVGSLSRYLGGLLANPRYNRWKRSVESVAQRLHLGFFRGAYYKVEEALKSLFLDSVFFEEFGLRYVGPVDGHNLHALIDAMQIARDAKRPILLHVSTKKGKGYAPAEEHPEKWHGTSGFDVPTGESPAKSGPPGYSSVFGAVMERLAAEDEKIVAITAAMPSGTGLTGFAERYPARFFDVGISEEHAAVFAAGLAASGCVPVYAVYSTFSQRAVDCVIHDICLQDLPVVICLDRAGVVGDDGPTHHGVFDIAMFRPVPGLTIMQPKDEAELANMLFTATKLGKPVVIRYPREKGPGVAMPESFSMIEVGKAEIMREGRDVQIWALGDMLPAAQAAAAALSDDGISVGVVNPRCIKPLDSDLLCSQAREAKLIVTVENGVVTGGFGDHVNATLRMCGCLTGTVCLGWPDTFVPQGKSPELMAQYGLDADGIAAAVRQGLDRTTSSA